MLRRAFYGLIVLLVGSITAAAQGLPRPSIWQNQRGSLLKILNLAPGGAFQGLFINRAQGFQCQGTPYAATGSNGGNRVVLQVNFAACQSVTTWSGTVNGATLTTRWVLRRPGQPALRGSDTFQRL